MIKCLRWEWWRCKVCDRDFGFIFQTANDGPTSHFCPYCKNNGWDISWDCDVISRGAMIMMIEERYE
jgi:hypothetical protein